MTRAQFLVRLAAVEAASQQRQQTVPDALTLLRLSGIVPDAWQEAVLQSPASRLLLNCSRQSGKSTVTAALALSTALAQPGSLILLLSPSLRQSQELFQKVLMLYRPYAGQHPAPQETALRLTLANGARIISLPGTEQTIRGYSGVDLLIIDEAARVADSLYYSVRPMLAVSGGRLIALSTPFGRRGWFYYEWAEGQGWARVRIPAQECPRISAAFLQEERRSLPELWYRSEYLCEFVDGVDQVFRSEDVEAALSDTVQPLFASAPWTISVDLT